MKQEFDPESDASAEAWLRSFRNDHEGTLEERLDWNDALDALGTAELSSFYLMMTIIAKAETDDEAATVGPYLAEFLSKSGNLYPAEISIEYELNADFAGFVQNWTEQTLRRLDHPDVLIQLTIDALRRQRR